MPELSAHLNGLREAFRRPATFAGDVVVALLVFGALGGVLLLARDAAAPLHARVEIDLSPSVLPYYAILSLTRGFAAYALSLVFTLVYGSIAAHNARAARFMIPALDVLQAIPVLGFLPGLVLALVNLFPTREIGLEIACVLMIFTGQVWNMTFSFHDSLRGIPSALREVAALNGFSAWQAFRMVEVPAAMIGLVWNSMMSMAGGWFFLTVNEAFTLGAHDYRLPGIGSYMSEAIHRGDGRAMFAAVVAMTLLIVLVDQCVWRPIVVWAQRFKVEDVAEARPPHSWVLDMVKRSRLLQRLMSTVEHARQARAASAFARRAAAVTRRRDASARERACKRVLVWIAVIAAMFGAAWGAMALVRLLLSLPVAGGDRGWTTVLLALAATFARTSAAVLIATIWALPAGILIGRSPVWSERLQGVIQVAASFPAPMVFPVVAAVLAWAGVPFTIGCVALMLLGAQWYVLFNVMAGAQAIPAEMDEVARVYRFSTLQRWTRLYVPAVFPHLLTGLVTAAGGAWNASIVSEYMQFRGQTLNAFGLGSLISSATERGDFPLLAASVVTMSLFVALVNRVFWKRLYRFAEARCSLNV